MEYTLHPINPAFGGIEPMDGGKISVIYIETPGESMTNARLTNPEERA